MVAMLRLRTAAIKQPDEMNRRAPTYFTRRFKSATTVALFNQSVEEHIHNFRSPSQPDLNWDAVKEEAAGGMVIGKPPLGRKSGMSDYTWALIEMRKNLKKDIEATPFVAVLHWKASIKLKTEKLSSGRDKRSHVEKLAKSAEEAVFVGDLGSPRS